MNRFRGSGPAPAELAPAAPAGAWPAGALPAGDFIGAFDTVRCVREDLQAGLGNLGFALGADTIVAVFDANKSSLDLLEGAAVVLHQAQRELLLEGVGAHVGHVDRHARQIA